MPQPTHLLLLFTLALLLSACEDDFTLEGDFVDVPTAYGYLNADDDRHFVRVQKAFLQAGGNALENAAVPDSIYYAPGEATVRLVNLTTQQSAVLDRVDGREFGFEREDGVFATSPNILYTVSGEDLDLRPEDIARLEIERPGEPTATAETQLLRDVTVIGPRAMVRFEPYGEAQATRLTLNAPEGAEVYAINILINLRAGAESFQLVWPIATEFVPTGGDQSGNNLRFNINNEDFYRFLRDNLEPRDAGFYSLRNLDIQVIAAGSAVFDRRTLSNANNGITSSQVPARFTNIDGGIGLFTSVAETIQEGITLSAASADSLANGVYTRALFN